jgi:hypothetical protein
MYFVYFPASAGGKIKYVLTEYLDVDEQKIRILQKVEHEVDSHSEKLSAMLGFSA